MQSIILSEHRWHSRMPIAYVAYRSTETLVSNGPERWQDPDAFHLSALQKHNGGVGSIAVGETLRQLQSGCAMSHVWEKAQACFQF